MTNRSIFGRKVAAAVAGGASARMLVHGHSHVAGQGSGSSGGLTNAALTGFCEKLATSFATYGLTAKRTGWMADYNTSIDGTNINTFDSRVGFGSGWVSHTSNNVLGGRHIWQSGTASGKGYLTYQPGFTFNGLRAWYPLSPGLSTNVGIYLDNALFTSLNQNGPVNAITASTISAGAPHSLLTVKENGGAGPAFWNGVEFYPTTLPNIAVTVAGGRGQTSDVFANGHDAWSPLPGLAAFSADLVVLYCMTNDLLTNNAVYFFKRNLAAMAVTSVVRGNCIIVVDPPATGSGPFINGTYEDYAEAAKSVAAQYGCGFVDTRMIFSRSWDRANADGLMNSAAHPNDTGHQYIADMIAQEAMKFVN
ncbi:SGNH/GDSL hydrolase family protein [Rhizobium sp. RCAM05973]|uniref:SGNH/GDSL hydrolase family protein n=1 Tax=Rhizobium sp. RCAM05973 TaxID=2994066 RepID=UPI0022EBB6A4|nr:SGNH/GDSL hydrolase family protein [Rhizobium sp. RCAM05973]